jgi:hypothetical protein
MDINYVLVVNIVFYYECLNQGDSTMWIVYKN